MPLKFRRICPYVITLRCRHRAKRHDTVFDKAVKKERLEIQEILFDYFFDLYNDYELKLTHSVQMIMKKSPFLERLIKTDFDV